MKFASLATYFEKLEATSSRLELIQILSDLFKTSDDSQEISEICYLVQGRIAPFYEPIEIGMADKMAASAIALACGVERDEVLKQYAKVGDLGEVAQQLSAKFPHKGDPSDKIQNAKLSVND